MYIVEIRYFVKELKSISILFFLLGLFLISGCSQEEDISNLGSKEKKIFREKMPLISEDEDIVKKSGSDIKQVEDEKEREIQSLSERYSLGETISKQDFNKDVQEQFRQEIREIRFEALSGGEEKVLFVMKGDGKRELFALEGFPPRIVLDFFSAEIADKVHKRIDINGKIIKTIRVGKHEDSEPRVRVVLDLAARKEHDYEVQPISYNDVNIYAIIVK
ncbi:MAG: AMIN domain-containing protein [Deltaproteobacteria bacterium]|nr:AMIN domain-containing protein [Deltaproteobacteria bacterium]